METGKPQERRQELQEGREGAAQGSAAVDQLYIYIHMHTPIYIAHLYKG